MYLIERLVGIITYVFILVIFCWYIENKQIKGKKLSKVLNIYKLILCIMAFFYIPSTTADLSRLTDEMHYFSTMSFSNILSLAISSIDPARILYMYFIGKIGIDAILPVTSCFIFFSFVFKIIVDSSKKFDTDSKSITLCLFLFMMLGKFLEVISGIRCLMAFSIVCYCIYKELVEGKKIIFHIPLYIFAALMHQATFALVIIRIMFLLFQKNKNVIKRIINYIIMLILLIILLRTSFFEEGVIVSLTQYTSGPSYFYVWEYIISMFSFIIYLITIIRFKKDICDNIYLKNLFRFIVFLCAFIAFFSFEYTIFSRYGTALSILMIPIFNYIINKMIQENRSYKNYCFVLYIYIIVTFFIVCSRGNLSGLKFFILS